MAWYSSQVVEKTWLLMGYIQYYMLNEYENVLLFNTLATSANMGIA